MNKLTSKDEGKAAVFTDAAGNSSSVIIITVLKHHVSLRFASDPYRGTRTFSGKDLDRIVLFPDNCKFFALEALNS